MNRFELNMFSILFVSDFKDYLSVHHLERFERESVNMNSAPRLVLTNLDRSGGKSEYYSADINLKVSSK